MSDNKKTNNTSVSRLLFLALFAVLTILGVIFHDQIYGENAWTTSNPTGIGIIDAILTLTSKVMTSIYILFFTLLVLYILNIVFSKGFSGTPRKVTIGKLVNSIVKVVVWVIAVLAVLGAWGMNIGAIIASAGVLTLVIGLGMQSLIADVVAGIFLVCDGTMQVGDIITIDGWRGTVQEIGIRNTKIMNYSGDIRITNNSSINTFINQSRVDSYPLITIGIEYDEDLERVEKVFEENKDAIRARIPLLTGGPDYKGVEQLGDSSVVLLFGAYCKECDIAQVKRDLNREIKLVFDKNGINIPFTQVVVHNAVEK